MARGCPRRSESAQVAAGQEGVRQDGTSGAAGPARLQVAISGLVPDKPAAAACHTGGRLVRQSGTLRSGTLPEVWVDFAHAVLAVSKALTTRRIGGVP